MLILPDGTEIFESLAIVNYITTNYPSLSPTKESTDYFQYWRMLSLLSSTLYSGYHRQHHANDYVNEIGFTSLKEKAQQEQSIIYDYIEQNLNPYLCGKIIIYIKILIMIMVQFCMIVLTERIIPQLRLRCLETLCTNSKKAGGLIKCVVGVS